jgi:DNA polymerase III sliding clamp (beta) subunit (PCNA family)
MKLPHGINPAHCASSDQTRFVLNGVKIEDGIAVATDGRVFMASTVELSEEDTNRPALIPTRAMMKAFPKSRGKRSRRSVIDTLRIDPIPEADPVATFGTVTITDKDLDLTTVKEIDGNFPKWHQVLEDPKPMTKRLTINVALLARIAKSFGDDGLTLHLDPDGFQAPGYKPPIYVTSIPSRFIHCS